MAMGSSRDVENEDVGIHDHRRRKVQQPLLPTRKLGDIAIEPVLDPEVGCRFGDSRLHGRVITPDHAGTERQLIEHRLLGYLAIGILANEADLADLLVLCNRSKINSIEKNGSRTRALRRCPAGEVTQQGRLPRSVPAAKEQVGTRFDIKVHVFERRRESIGKCERQMVYFEMRHARPHDMPIKTLKCESHFSAENYTRIWSGSACRFP